jgi:integrase/recombinase XerC
MPPSAYTPMHLVRMDALSAWDGWRGALRGEVADDTWRQYAPAVLRFLALSGLARTPVEAISRTHILTFFGEHYARGGWARVQCHAALTHFFRWAELERILVENPMAHVKVKRPHEDDEPDSLTPDELGALVVAVERLRGRRASLAVLLSYCMATRRKEICGLRWEDIYDDADGSVAELRETKGGTPRKVALSGTALAILDELRRLPCRYQRLAREGYVVGVGRETFSEWVDKAGKLAGLPERKTHSHILRASFATDALEDGADVRTVQKVLGHAKLTTTMRYLRVTAKAKRAAAEMIGERAAILL